MDMSKIQGLLDLVSKDHTIVSVIFLRTIPLTILFSYNFISNRDCRTRHHGGSKNNPRLWKKKNRYLASCSFRKKVFFEESPPSIMVTRNPKWSTEILWLGIGYVKGKILSPLKRSA
jgi:hypothetical protein